MDNKNRIEYVIYALVNGKSTRKYVCEDYDELIETFNNALADDIQEEELYQTYNEEDDYE